MSESANTNACSARDKIKTLDQLAELAQQAQATGLKVVLCHGVFDLLHMGHVRHLEVAKREGDMLIVTVSADAFVNKGPGRPIFPDTIRAEMLAAVGYVDWVGINHSMSAETVLNAVKPDVYVKGSDYENPDDDVTGKIQSERDTIESHGGKLVFTRDVTFSSSSLINRYFDVYDPPLRDYLDQARAENALPQILEMIEKVKNFKVLLVGDTIIDEYQYVSTLGKSPKENMIATLFENKELFAGGVIAAANHVAEFCAKVDILTVLGEGDPHDSLVRQALKPNVGLTALYRPDAPTTRKCRFVEPNYMRKLFEVYHMDDSPAGDSMTDSFNQRLAERIQDYDLVLVTDFGHGCIQPSTIELMADKARYLAVNAQSNSANMGFNLITKYPRADYICIDAPEARMAVRSKNEDLSLIASDLLPRKIRNSRVILTHGKHGCVTYQQERGSHRIPAFTKTVVDTVGAGDAFLAITSPLVAAGGRMDHVGFVGNAAGAIKVGIVGHRSSVEKAPLVKFITTLLK
ncbi:cytidyltransferase [Paramagnetospirillum marisnigri]|uniref:Cytidyltransferase n=1 Tax=Paramagnetospirillum marisnigri TaxID=1285242 RepID=A0A178MMW4_9PROT|nr:PfkB family carbohydrate kinase [Paramagnetospirillum marisnigri]OAN49274.1 cytidyltransferase [Paramagnetospirillum marisnigri]